MGKKAEVGTPKHLANKMKSKGLQKLRWYCQMCQKQCRDQNGFKCHIQSESHQRQLLIFADNPNRFLGDFSKEFEDGFMHLLKRRHSTKRVEANKVYQEYIGEKDHLHMNATRWTTLTGFVMYLGKTGKCVVDETEKGWYITWIDRDPETIARQEALAKKKKLDKDDEERMAEFIEKQVAKANEDKEKEEKEYAEFVRENEEEKIKLELKSVKNEEKKPTKFLTNNIFKDEKAGSSKKLKQEDADKKRKKTALEEIMEEEEEKKKKKRDTERKESSKNGVKDYWLKKNIVVKIVTKSLGEKYYKQKGYVKEVIDKYAALVVLLDGNAKIKLDQDHLETVIPGVGKDVFVLNGEHRGKIGVLRSVDFDKFCACVKLEDGQKVDLPYEHFSKIHLET